MILVCLFLHKIPFYILCNISSQSKSFSFAISCVMSSGFSLNSYTPQVGSGLLKLARVYFMHPFLFCWRIFCAILEKLWWSISLLSDTLSMSNRCAGLMQLYVEYPNGLHLIRHFYSQCSWWNLWAFQWQGRNQIDVVTI